MEKEFIPYEQALALKELGFDEPCFWWYDFEKELRKDRIGVNSINSKYFLNGNSCSAPLYQQCFRWFRDKYNLYIEIRLDSYKEPYSLKVTIRHLDDTNTFIDKEYYPFLNGIGDIDNKKYEEAELEGLKKLIEIVKEK
jgi:hypothetical protein